MRHENTVVTICGKLKILSETEETELCHTQQVWGEEKLHPRYHQK
jgi:hypothetical protein